MVKTFTILLFMILALGARENPFFPANGEADIPLSSNQVTTLPPLKRATLTLPSTARVLESVTVKYKNLDGSVHEKTEILQNSIDWHLPLFISQNYGDSASIPETIKVKKRSKFVKIASLKFITLYTNKNELKVVTKDKMIRNFLLVKPHRIVCDFKREIDIRSYEKDINNKSRFTKLRVGYHTGYYRVVIELDGYYRYKLQKRDNGYLFTLI